MSINEDADAFRELFGLPQSGEEPIATFARALVDPVSSNVVLEVNRAGQVVNGSGQAFALAGALDLAKTITPAGQTGAKTIDTPLGTVNFAAGAAQLIVTSALAKLTSLIFPVLLTNDASAVLDSVVRANGSFTIVLSNNCAAETAVGFLVLN